MGTEATGNMAAAGGGVSPFTAGLMGQAGSDDLLAQLAAKAPPKPPLQTPDVPERNPLFATTPVEQDLADRMKANRAGYQSVMATELPAGTPPPQRQPMQAPSQNQPQTPPAMTPQPAGLLADNTPQADPMPAMSADPSTTAPLQAASGSSTPEQDRVGLLGKVLGPNNQFVQGLGTFQDKLGDATTNPLFQVGMGLLASGYDKKVNPYLQVGQNLGALNKQQIANQGSDQDAAKLAAEAETNRILAQLLGQAAPQTTAQTAGAGGRPAPASFIRRG